MTPSAPPDMKDSMAAGAKAVLVTLGVLMVGWGLLASLLGVRGAETFSTSVVGLAGSVHYAGFLAGAIVIPRLLSSVGHIRVYGAIASSAAVTALAFPFVGGALMWVSIRLLLGLCLAGMFIVAESWLNAVSTNATRGKLMATYIVVINSAVAAGQLLLTSTGANGVLPFVVASALFSISVVPLSLTRAPSPSIPPLIALPPFRQVFSVAPLGPITSLVSGLGVGVAIGMGAVWAIASGLAVGSVAILIAVGMLGGVVLQWPIGAMSDRIPRRRVILGAASLATGCALLGLAFEPGTLGSYLAFGLFTAMSFPLYSLAISHVNDVIEPELQVAASSVLTMAYGAGSIVGPVVAGFAFQTFGTGSFWVLMATSTGVLIPYAVYRLIHRPVLAQRLGFRTLSPEPSTLPTLFSED